MNKKHIFIVPVVSFLITGCASIMSGTDQDIAIHTNPEGAECILTRENRQLRKVTTPDNVRVSKLKHDIYVKCSMEGFHDSTAHVNSGTQGSTFGNILLGGGIGWAIDSARGADNKYADVVTVTMVPLTQVAPESIVVGADGTMLKKSEADALKAEEIKKKKEAEDAVSTEKMKADGDVEGADDVVSRETDAKSEENP
ncbi:MAG: hypothetical protein L3J50_06695 [Emcibacter sp.]|nr:hypothetical protein [Emcibacter sp.]